jgi:ubiquinol-cytochrome c reductase subunit 7
MSTFTQLESISKYILSKPLLKSIFVPASRVFTNLAGYREMGLRTEDLFIEESEVYQTALRRLPENDSYARVFRLATAAQLSLSHKLLPKNEWLKPEEVSGVKLWILTWCLLTRTNLTCFLICLKLKLDKRSEKTWIIFLLLNSILIINHRLDNVSS